MDKKEKKIKLKKQIALNVPMDETFMERIALAASKIHVGKAAFARMAIEEKMQRENLK